MSAAIRRGVTDIASNNAIVSGMLSTTGRRCPRQRTRAVRQLQQHVTRRTDAGRTGLMTTPVACVPQRLPPTREWRFPPILGFTGNWRQHQCPDPVSLSSGDSHGQKDLPPDRMAAIMPASGGWFTTMRGGGQGADQQLAPSTYIKLGLGKEESWNHKIRS